MPLAPLGPRMTSRTREDCPRFGFSTPRMRGLSMLTLAISLFLGPACVSAGVGPNASAPLVTVDSVDLERFAGLWYVISSMPTGAEEGAHNSTEYYALRENGEIDITNRFRVDGFEGPEKVIRMRGWIHDDATAAEWRVQPIWPIRLSYLILELSPDYEYTVVGHPSKQYVWIMSRTPHLDRAIEDRLRSRLAESGYDVRRIVPMPQQALGDRD